MSGDWRPVSTAQYTSSEGEVPANVAWANYCRKAFVCAGRATRSEYNWALVMVAVLWVVVALPAVNLISNGVVLRSIEVVFLVVIGTPWFALIARRCHDMNRQGTFGLLMLVPGIGFIVGSGFMILGDSDPQGIRFDPPHSRSLRSSQ